MIIWSDEAKEDYWDNIDFLLELWTIVEATNFIEKVDYTLLIITEKPQTFQKTDYKDIHSVPIVPQVTLYYRIVGLDVELVRFWLNRKDPSKLKL